MSIQTQARSLLTRHHKLVVNREKSLLARTAAEIGVDVDPGVSQPYSRQNLQQFSNSL